VAPWSGFWDRNGLATWLPSSAWLASPFVRGGVTGVGLITSVAGLVELASVFGLRRSAEADVVEPPPSS
jgi:hypothetical protein